MTPLGIGLLGLGNVGTAVARLLTTAPELLSSRVGRQLVLCAVAVRDPAKPRSVTLGGLTLDPDARRVVNDPAVDVVIELIGGIEPARSLVIEALTAGKDVVTANKALIAECGAELFATARRSDRVIAFEGSVAGGIPIVQALANGLAANQVQSLAAIVNGTCNFILSAMSTEGLTYHAALAHAQALGYAEADPTLDVDGTDAAHKLAILAQLAFRTTVTMADIPRVGINCLQAADIRYAAELGYAIKLLALARLAADGSLILRVAPCLVRQGTPLADVRGAYNAIRIVGDVVGDTLFYGKGAGAMPTASAVLGDLIDVAAGRAACSFRVQNLWPENVGPPRLASLHQVSERTYMRFMIADRPGVIGRIAQILGQHEISIASVIQHDPGEDDHPDAPVPLILMSHASPEAARNSAIAEIDALDVVRAPSVCMSVAE